MPAAHLELRSRVETLVGELTALEAELDDDPETPIGEETAARVRERARELGIYGMHQPREFGGTEAGALELAVAHETLAAANLRLGSLVFGPRPGVLGSAEGRLRDAYLEPLLRGEKHGAFAFTEPGDAERPTWATYDGDDLVVHGRKAYVTGGATADFMTALVNVEAADAGPGGTAMLVIDRVADGVRIDREFRSMEGGGHVSITFEGVRVPRWHVIGEVGEGLPRALRNIDSMRLIIAARATGLIQWAARLLEGHLQAPHRIGTPLGEREGVRLRYSEVLVEGYAARSMLYRTARLVDSGEPAGNEVAATKLYATEAVGRAIDTAVQLVGGGALIVGHPLERTYRQVRSLRLAEGASDLLRISIARARLEGQPTRM